MITKTEWVKHQPQDNPFLNYEFTDALLKSQSIKSETGWTPAFLQNENGVLLNFIKSHSYGEYIFDWAWAEAYSRHGVPYYPKMTSLIPFTPVTTQHFLMHHFNEEHASELLKAHVQQYLLSEVSSTHFLFLSPNEIGIFKKHDFLIRESIQYHFFNPGYKSFEDFLSHLKTKKAKNIKNERNFKNIVIKKYTGTELTIDHARQMYQFYISTIVNKNSHNYLNEKFFELIFTNMSQNILYIEASIEDFVVAGSLFFFDSEKLYGRYWGSNQYIENLHFELCYYQGIDFCIENNISVFEAGAQGEHKIARGFRPVQVFSAHKIKHPVFFKAISEFIETEKIHLKVVIEKLSESLPFKK